MRTLVGIENSLLSWVLDHLGVYHTMNPDVTENPVSPPRVESAEPTLDPQLVQDEIPLPEKENNIMT